MSGVMLACQVRGVKFRLMFETRVLYAGHISHVWGVVCVCWLYCDRMWRACRGEVETVLQQSQGHRQAPGL